MRDATPSAADRAFRTARAGPVIAKRLCPHGLAPATLGTVPAPARDRNRAKGAEHEMKDLIYVAVTVLFFVLSWVYVKGLERL
jgi:hypothetical protein